MKVLEKLMNIVKIIEWRIRGQIFVNDLNILNQQN